jgi:stress response protein SCP2
MQNDSIKLAIWDNVSTKSAWLLAENKRTVGKWRSESVGQIRQLHCLWQTFNEINQRN